MGDQKNRFEEQMRAINKRMKQAVADQQDDCPHRQGCNPLSDNASPLSSFALQRTRTGEIVGVCTVCGKTISSNNPKDEEYFRLRTGNQMATADLVPNDNLTFTTQSERAALRPSIREEEREDDISTWRLETLEAALDAIRKQRSHLK